MSDHDFEHLDAKNFERMAAVLCAEYIARGLRIFGSGTDGGREATFEGKTHYPSPSAPWEGYTVVQCKQKQSRANPKEEAAWAIRQLDAEMKKYKTAKKTRRVPAYFLFITNANLSAQLITGGKDLFIKRLKFWINELGMIDADVWDRDKLNNLVDSTPKVAERFGLLHSGNLIHYAAQAFLSHQQDVETTLSVFLQEELRTDQFVLLSQAGHAGDDRPPLARVFVDLQATLDIDPEQEYYVVKEVQTASNRPLHPTLLLEEQQAIRNTLRAAIENDEAYEEFVESEEEAEMLQELRASLPEEDYGPSRFVIIGGPGQGKTTAGQYLAQRHRAALLKANTTKTLEAETRRTLREIEQAAAESGTGLPTFPRWPFRVILEDFAEALAKGQVSSVLEHLAALVRKRSKREFSARDAELLLANAALLVVFDGLDEVPAVSNRAEVLDAIRRFLYEARDKDADLLVIATTRPQGYQNDFHQFSFKELTLRLLTPQQALDYAQKLVDVKYANDEDRRQRIMGRLKTAAQEDAIERLIRTPLQVTIMAELVDLIGILPRERYVLFERYYEIIYQREQARGFALSRVLADYRTTIEILHDRIGLALQVEAESKEKPDSRISGTRLRRMVHDYLVQEEEHSGEELARLTASFMDVALHRLVFVVPLEDERYGFEVRSLQEFSAARAIMRGNYDVVKERLRAISPVPYWRNTMLFAVGQAFAKQNVQHCDLIMQLCRELDDNDDPVLAHTMAGSRLALDIIEDGIVELKPRYRKLFTEAMLHLLRLSHTDTAKRLTKAYSPREESQYVKEVQAAVGSSGFDELVGLFTLLATLAQQEGDTWACALLHRHWPVQVADQQLLIALPSVPIIPGPWADEVISRVAQASSLEWLIGVKSRIRTSTEWVNLAGELRMSLEQDVRFAQAGRNTPFEFSIFYGYLAKRALSSLTSAQPSNYDWTPFTVGRQFMVNPSPDTLADTLEALVRTDSWAPGRTYRLLPWQLEPLLHDALSSAELLRHAQRARAGELGTQLDWLMAEERWRDESVTAKDLATFSDAQWPYTGDIAIRGFVPFSRFKISGERNRQNNNVSAQALLKGFELAPSARYRQHIAAAFFFAVGHGYNPDLPITLPVDKLVELTMAARWQVYGLPLLGLLGIDVDWIGEAKGLDIIGGQVSALGNSEQGHPAIREHLLPAAIAGLVSLVGTKQVREGILRLLATLAVARGTVPVPNLDFMQLSADGRVALVALNMLSETPLLSAVSLTELILGLWEHPHPRTGTLEVRRVLSQVCRRRGIPLAPPVLQVLSNLRAAASVEAGIKLEIVECFIQQLQFRTSGLGDPAWKAELATDWLFELLNQ